MLKKRQTYEEVKEEFEWEIPEYYNIGVDICDKWALREPDRTALIVDRTNGDTERYSFGDLMRASNRLANLLLQMGIEREDRIAILLPQAPETAIAHIGIHKAGGISIPLFMLFGEEALQYRLEDSGARIVVTNKTGAARLSKIRTTLPELEHVLCIDEDVAGTVSFHQGIQAHSDIFSPAQTKAEDPALIIYTSGTTGQPKGALHAHRVLLGHLPGVEISHDFFPVAGDKIWTPADWAWIGGLLDVLFPALHHGIAVVCRRFDKFTAEAAFNLIEKHGIRNAFIPPTALKMMRTVNEPEKRWNLKMRTIASGGETLGVELLDWGQKTFGLTINEFYGQTECNMIVSSCAELMPARPGIIGRPVPGHQVEVLKEDGKPAPVGMQGDIAVKAPDPVMFLRYWNNLDATAAKYKGDWLLTGDTGIRDADGWIKFVGRDDDVITSSGYRIGPGEIEDCLLGHPDVELAGVIGKPDAARTEIVLAFIVLRKGVDPSDSLAKEIQNWVKIRLAAHEYPREVRFVDELPMTTTGKIIRADLRRLITEEKETRIRKS
ncbi:MAG: AMP-dependent synthetase [Alphaproteobacteria bacterium]|nr:MAG: AMP-dependent synthetase [Alphaproteobacteria bacterium]